MGHTKVLGTGHISWCMLLTILAVELAVNDRFNVVSDWPSAELQLISSHMY